MSALRSHGLRPKVGCSGRRGSNGPEDVRRSPRPNSTPNCSGRTNTADSSARRPGPAQYGSHIPATWPCHTSCTLPYGTSVLPFSLGVLVDPVGRSANWLKFGSGGRAVPRQIATVEVLRVVAQHVDGVLRRAERWRVGEFEVGQLRSAEPGPDGRCQHVDAFVEPLLAYALGTEDLASRRVHEHLETHGLSPGVVAGVRGRMRVDREVRSALGEESLFVPARRRDGKVENLDDGGADRGAGSHRATGDVVCHHSTVSVGDVGERYQRGRSVEGVGLLGGVAHRVHVPDARAIELVHGDAAEKADALDGSATLV